MKFLRHQNTEPNFIIMMTYFLDISTLNSPTLNQELFKTSKNPIYRELPDILLYRSRDLDLDFLLLIRKWKLNDPLQSQM